MREYNSNALTGASSNWSVEDKCWIEVTLRGTVTFGKGSQPEISS